MMSTSDSRRSTPTSGSPRPASSSGSRHHMHSDMHTDKDDQMTGGERGDRSGGGDRRSNSNSITSGAAAAGGLKYDDPPNSRLFIVCGRQITEDQFKEGFGVYGKIEEIWLVKDRVSKAPKGITYIKFSKTSEAALAMEEMNGKCIGGCPRPLKVLIAHSRDQGSKRELNEDERLVRLFIVVSKEAKESDVSEHFKQFGDIDYVSIVRDRNTKESKGFAYIKFHRMSHAAKAFEDCNRSYKPVFADPKPVKGGHEGGGGHPSHGGMGHGGPSPQGRGQRQGDHHRGGVGGARDRGGPGSTTSGSTNASYDPFAAFGIDGGGHGGGGGHHEPHHEGRVLVSISGSVHPDLVWRLFDLVPGLEQCEPESSRHHHSSHHHSSHHSSHSNNNKFATYSVIYSNPNSAVYARDKLNGFEYPPGQRMLVKLSAEDHRQGGMMGHHRPGGMGALPGPRTGNMQNDIVNLTETIATATAYLQQATGYSFPATGGAAAAAAAARMAADMAKQADMAAGGISGMSGSSRGAGGSGGSVSGGDTYDPSYCSVKLPSPKPLAPIESEVEERLFVVCTPTPPPLYALKDVFGRFGNLIDIYIINSKTYGYAKYASKESADAVVAALHGQEICGSRLKVMLADPHDKDGSGGGRKRPKIDAN